MSARFSESIVEQAALAWLEAIGWRVVHGPDIAPDMPAAERAGYGKVALARRLRDALARLNPALPPRRWMTHSASSRGPKVRNSSRATELRTDC